MFLLPKLFISLLVQGALESAQGLKDPSRGPCPWKESLQVGLEEPVDAPCSLNRRA